MITRWVENHSPISLLQQRGLVRYSGMSGPSGSTADTFMSTVVYGLFGISAQQESRDQFHREVLKATTEAIQSIKAESPAANHKALTGLNDTLIKVCDRVLKNLAAHGYKLQHPEMTEVPIREIEKVTDFIRRNNYVKLLIKQGQRFSDALRRMYGLMAIQQAHPQEPATVWIGNALKQP